MNKMLRFLIVLLVGGSCLHAADLRFERIVIDDNFPGAYQVEIADINGDKKPDIIAVGESTCAWYENPSWKKRIISGPKQTPGIISSATLDIDGDGKAEVAIAYDFEMNEPTRGKLGLASQGGRGSLELPADHFGQQHPPAPLGRRRPGWPGRAGRGLVVRPNRRETVV